LIAGLAVVTFNVFSTMIMNFTFLIM